MLASNKSDLEKPGLEEEKATESDGEVITNPFLIAAFDSIVTHPMAVLGMAVLSLIVTGSIAMPFNDLKNKPMSLDPPVNRLTHVTNALQTNFMIKGTSAAPDALITWCDSCNLTERPAFIRAQHALVDMLADLKASDHDCHAMTWESMDTAKTPAQKKQFIAPDSSAGVLLVYRNETLEMQQVSSCLKSVRNRLTALDGAYGGLRISLGNPIATAMISADTELKNLGHHIAISLPILCILFYCYVGSVWKVSTAILTMAMSICWERCVIVLIKRGYPNFNFSGGDTMSMFVMIALSLDYAVIFWGRFHWERKNRPDAVSFVPCILSTLKSAGLVIMVSVVVLEVGFLGMLGYPSLNYSGNFSLIIMMCVIVFSVGVHSLVIPAALAAQFPSFYEERPSWIQSLWYRAMGNCQAAVEGEQPRAPEHSPAERFFRWWAKVATRPPMVFVLPVVAYGCMMPFICQLGTFRPFYDVLDLFMDKTLTEYEAYNVYKNRFTTNHASPTMLLLEVQPLAGHSFLQTELTYTKRRSEPHGSLAPDGLDVLPMQEKLRSVAQQFGLKLPPDFNAVTLSPEFRNASCALAQSIVNRTKGKSFRVRPIDIEGAWWDPDKGCRTVPALKPGATSMDGTKQLMTIYPDFDALSTPAQHLTDFIWDEIEPAALQTFTSGGVTYQFKAEYWSEVGVMMLDDKRLQSRAPAVIAVTVVVICAVVGLFFRSVGVTLKVALSVVVPMLCNYGILISIWQNGWFRWLGLTPSGGVMSTVMFTSFGFLLGLAIDYDIVLFARVYERRMQGYDNLSAVQMGLVETGPMVTLAGTLMVSSFVVMCFDQLAAVRMMAGLYFVGVALDTYIVRTCIAPTMLVLAGKLNYWPGKVPPETKSFSL